MTLRPALDRFVGWLCRLLLRLFFRRVAVVGAERIPASGPYLVVANHVNGLIDPMFVFGPLRIAARTLGKSTLWKIPVLAQLLDLAGAIPVHRRKDEGVDTAKNVETFARCHELLAAGGKIAIFPEGISHDEPRLQPLRTGAARIAIEAERIYGVERPLGVQIVPVGLLFEERGRFRSRVLVVVGQPIDPSPEIAQAAIDEIAEVAAVRALTARIAAAIEKITLNYASWEEARLVELGADVLDRERRARPAGERWKGELAMRRTVAAALERLRGAHPELVAAAVAAGRDYEGLLRAVGVTDDQVMARVPLRLALAFFARTIVRLGLAAPVAAVGTVLNLVPWWIVHAISARYRGEPNQIATYQLFPGMVLYPGTWLAEAFGVGRRFGAGWGVAVGLAGPLAGWIALRWHERRRALWRESRAFLLLRNRREVAAELRTRRREVESAVERLASYARGEASSVPTRG